MSQLFAYITNSENYLQSKKLFSFKIFFIKYFYHIIFIIIQIIIFSLDQNITTKNLSITCLSFEKSHNKDIKIQFINFLPLVRTK